MPWDPQQYLHYADERLRPFGELIGRIAATDPSQVVDLGCGPGNATRLLHERWPHARILGIDNSREMIEQANKLAVPGRVRFEFGDIVTFIPQRPVEVLVSNAALQWVPGHLGLFKRLLDGVVPGGWFAFQVPTMVQEPSHRGLYEIAESERWAERLAPIVRLQAVEDAATYLEALAELGCKVDVWETRYFQILLGENAVFEWTSGTTLRPFLATLEEEDASELISTYTELLSAAYPRKAFGTVYPFRRIFVVARKPD